MQASHRMTRLLLALMTLVAVTSTGRAADPGAPYPAGAGPNDLRPGSVLLFNYYTSGAGNDTRIAITNTSATTPAFVHLFFVDGATCSVADVTICLTENQTSSFLASEFDPGTTGYIFAVGFGPALPFCPSESFLNRIASLIGCAHIRLGGAGTVINALVIDGIDIGPCVVAPGADFQLTIPLRVPRVLAVDSIASLADGTRTFLVVNRVGGNLLTGPGAIGAIFGLLFDDQENSFSFTISGNCQIRSFLSATFPRTVPPFTRVIPARHTGWMKFFAAADRGIAGVVIDFDANGSIAGRNLHVLTLTNDSITIPVFGNNCF